MNSSIDLLIGMPFLRYHHFISHYCQDTYIYTSNVGHRLTIPLRDSHLDAPCIHKHCPFNTTPTVNQPLPTQPPFVPPHRKKHSALSEPKAQKTIPNSKHQKHLQPLHPQTVPKTNTPATRKVTFQDTIPPISQPTTQTRKQLKTPKQRSPKTIFSIRNTVIPDLIDTFIDNNTMIDATQLRRALANNPDTALYLCTPRLNNIISSDTSEHSDKLKKQLLKQFPHVFIEEPPPTLPPSDRLPHAIDLTPNHTIPPRRLYRQTPDELTETKRQIDEYLKNGHVRPSTSPFGAPVLLVKKKTAACACVSTTAHSTTSQSRTTSPFHESTTFTIASPQPVTSPNSTSTAAIIRYPFGAATNTKQPVVSAVSGNNSIDGKHDGRRPRREVANGGQGRDCCCVCVGGAALWTAGRR